MADIKLDVSRVVGNLQNLASKFAQEDIAGALYLEAEETAGLSKTLTPVDTGALRDSHTVSQPVITNNEISVTIGVGGPAAPYAVIVHEVVETHHTVGQAKFLQLAVLQRSKTMAMRIANKIAAKLRKK